MMRRRQPYRKKGKSLPDRGKITDRGLEIGSGKVDVRDKKRPTSCRGSAGQW